MLSWYPDLLFKWKGFSLYNKFYKCVNFKGFYIVDSNLWILIKKHVVNVENLRIQVIRMEKKTPPLIKDVSMVHVCMYIWMHVLCVV